MHIYIYIYTYLYDIESFGNLRKKISRRGEKRKRKELVWRYSKYIIYLWEIVIIDLH